MVQTTQCKSTKCKEGTASVKPLGTRILIQRIEENVPLKGGIILPDSAKKKQEQARVVALGTGKNDKQGNPIPFSVQVGDIVLIEKYSGQEVPINGVDYIIVRDEDLIAIIQQSSNSE